MVAGYTPEAAREKIPSVTAAMILVPYYGNGTSDQTYEALTGRKVQNVLHNTLAGWYA